MKTVTEKLSSDIAESVNVDKVQTDYTPTRFIVFEGMEGAGKSTQIALLANRLAESGISVVKTREPGGTDGAEAIREVILKGTAKEYGPDFEAMLFAAARADHVDQVIFPALNSGSWVLCDRFTDSTAVYQGEGGADRKLISELEDIALGNLSPDLTVVLDLPASIGMKRAYIRTGEQEDSILDRFESENVHRVQEKRRRSFLKIARKKPDKYLVIDGQQSIEKVGQQIWEKVCKLAGIEIPDEEN